MRQAAWQETTSSLILAYGFFSKVFQEKPDDEFLRTLADGDLFAHWPITADDEQTAKGLHLLRHFMQQWDKEDLPDLVQDYHQLFIGPTIKAVPWESAWLSREHLLFDEQTMEVRELYRNFGLQTPLLGIEPDDHIGLEFAFMMHLFVQSLAFYESQSEAAFQQVKAAQYKFYTRHMMAWIPDCLKAIIRESKFDYYKGAAELCLGCLNVTGELLEEMQHLDFSNDAGREEPCVSLRA